ncbi:MAG: T9SS type A sorting domain-containing protein, partial [Ignavibacteriales bacterium]|nr:T9SS type A sorting domain-containing protein [Ignavibacteriales bacterium]
TFSFSTNPALITSANNFPGLFTFELNQYYPNPFNPATTISFSLDKPSFVSLSVYNILGEKIEEIFKGIRQSGYHRFHFSGDNLSSGMYIYRLETGSRTISRKMMLIK